ncbi:MAG TPA: hypothetical protein VIJ11_04335 [Galbitalea sp.]
MPTVRRRYQVTETPEVERAIDVAAERWPDQERSRLLLRVIQAGAVAVESGPTSVTESRRRAIRRAASGEWADAFGPDYLAKLREDWPE